MTPFDNTLAFIGDDSIVYRIAGTGSGAARCRSCHQARTICGPIPPAAIMASSHAVEGHAFSRCSRRADWTRVFDAARRLFCMHSRRVSGSARRKHFRVKARRQTVVGDGGSPGNRYFLDRKKMSSKAINRVVCGASTRPLFHMFPNGGVIDATHIDVARLASA